VPPLDPPDDVPPLLPAPVVLVAPPLDAPPVDAPPTPVVSALDVPLPELASELEALVPDPELDADALAEEEDADDEAELDPDEDAELDPLEDADELLEPIMQPLSGSVGQGSTASNRPSSSMSLLPGVGAQANHVTDQFSLVSLRPATPFDPDAICPVSAKS
jgi:hypothetical protein